VRESERYFLVKTSAYKKMENLVGKGDRRTRRGKIWRGSHGKTRSRTQEKEQARKRHGPKPSQIQQKNQESS